MIEQENAIRTRKLGVQDNVDSSNIRDLKISREETEVDILPPASSKRLSYRQLNRDAKSNKEKVKPTILPMLQSGSDDWFNDVDPLS